MLYFMFGFNFNLYYLADYPDTWVPQPEEGGRPKPSHMFEVDAGSTEFQDAVKEFELSMTRLKYTIVAVKRIQTPNEYMKHCALRQSMQQKHGKKVQERRLFHGTRQESINAIAVQGFNRIFAADANGKCNRNGKHTNFCSNVVTHTSLLSFSCLLW